MKAVFFGTPDFAVPSLQILLDKHEVLAVVTQPDKQKGRGKKLLPPPVKQVAELNGISVLQPERVKDEAFITELAGLQADVFIVAAYGRILPVRLLEMPRYGCINVHGSLLPAYRGAAPIQWSLINGEEKTGITIMHMDKGIDTGDMILKKELVIEPEDDYGSLHDKMACLGAEALNEALNSIESGTAVRECQDHSRFSYAHMITKQMGHIDWSKNTASIHNLVRGLTPTPGAYTCYKGEILKICRGIIISGDEPGEPGQVIRIENKTSYIVVKTSDGYYGVTELQAPGGKRMKAADYLRGHMIEPGEILE